MNEIIPIYKPPGLSPLDLIRLFKKTFPLYKNEKISPAGRLDPMAEGLLLLLVGKANKERNAFLSLDKWYEFSLLLGVTTDTYDLLGKVTATNYTYQSNEILSKVSDNLSRYAGIQQQEYPPYSSKPVQGKPLFAWARQNRLHEISIPSNKIEIKNLSILSMSSINTQEILTHIIRSIESVNGDFRQKEIIGDWKNALQSSPQELLVINFSANVTSGTYIRSLCNTLGGEIGVGGIAYSIKRTRIGTYKLDDAVVLTY
ncbi:hypothetical protein BH09PAT1_BH09PAT1_0290 [soil metagenome]